MAWKTEATTRATMRAHGDGAPVRLFSRKLSENMVAGSPRVWIFRPTKGKDELALKWERADLEVEGYRYERTIKPRSAP